MSTTTLESFVHEVQLSTSASELMYANANEKLFIGQASFTNTSSSAAIEVTIWKILRTTTPTTGDGGNWIAKKSISPGKMWLCYEIIGKALEENESIWASAATASRINCDISGTKDI